MQSVQSGQFHAELIVIYFDMTTPQEPLDGSHGRSATSIELVPPLILEGKIKRVDLMFAHSHQRGCAAMPDG